MSFVSCVGIELQKIRRSKILWLLWIPAVLLWLPVVLVYKCGQEKSNNLYY